MDNTCGDSFKSSNQFWSKLEVDNVLIGPKLEDYGDDLRCLVSLQKEGHDRVVALNCECPENTHCVTESRVYQVTETRNGFKVYDGDAKLVQGVCMTRTEEIGHILSVIGIICMTVIGIFMIRRGVRNAIMQCRAKCQRRQSSYEVPQAYSLSSAQRTSIEQESLSRPITVGHDDDEEEVAPYTSLSNGQLTEV